MYYIFSVWLTNGGFNNSFMIGNTILPLMPLASPVVMPTVPQPQTIFLVQKPSSLPSNKDTSFPLINQIIPMQNLNKTYSNIFGMDITKTTMVNKVPISAFSSTTLEKTNSSKKKARILKVSQKNHRRFLKSLMSSKPLSPPSETNKENIVKADENPKVNISETLNENLTNEENKSNSLLNKESKNDYPSQINNNPNTEKDVENEKLSQNLLKDCEKVDDTSKMQIKSSDNDKNLVAEKSIFSNKNDEVIKVRDISISINMEESNSLSDKSKINDITISNSDSNIFINETVKEISKDTVEKRVSDKIEKFNEKDTTAQNIVSEETTCIPLQTECRSGKNKIATANNTVGASEITEDILASFGGSSEPTMQSSPLATSPLAASPTAAFLSNFPLVYSGPRPDTPSNDNLQTPHIYSLDNFSSFFPSKETSINHIASSSSINMYSECGSKSLNQLSNGKYKQGWSQNTSNNPTYGKSLIPDMSNSTSKYPKDNEYLKDKSQAKLSTSSSTCILTNTQPNYPNTKSVNTTSQYSMPETMYNYENPNVMDNLKGHSKNIEYINDKSHFNFQSNSVQNISKKTSSSNNDNTCTTVTSNYINNVPSTVACNNKNYEYNMLDSTGDVLSCKRNQNNDGCMKLVLPGVIPDCSTSKSIEMPFGFPTQSKSVFHNSSNIYTTCNTYNPFSSDFSSNSMNLSISCGNSLNPIRTKTSTTYIPEFNSNIFHQNCSLWNEENNQIESDTNKIDYNRRLNLPVAINQSQSHSTAADFQTNIRVPPVGSSKCFSSKQNTLPDSKNFKNNVSKCPAKEVKYSNENKNKSEFLNQKGPVNWMTSDVGQHNNDMFFPNYKEIKHEQNSLLPITSQPCVEPISNISGTNSTLNCKKTDVFDQPFLPLPPGSYVSQVVSEDNQFTWSPSKLATFGDNSSLAPCSLPTLVGDLALGIGTESKISYHNISTEQESSAKDRKCGPQKSKEIFPSKINCSQSVDINPTNGIGNFLSVSQLMERGKMESSIIENGPSCKPCMGDNHKRPVLSDNHERQYDNQLSLGNKPYEINQSIVSSALFPSDNYAATQHIDNSLSSTKEPQFNNKLDSNSKNVNKNNYSTEALLQNNNTNYQHIRKQKSNNNIQKSYADNSNFPIASNQYMSSNHPLQFDNFPQNQQFVSNAFPYTSSAVTMNSTFYSSANFISSSNNSAAPNYINSGFPVEFTEFPNTLSDNIFYPAKVDNCKPKMESDIGETSKYGYNSKSIASSKDTNIKTKTDICNKKESITINKRQKKHKNPYSNNYGIPERCFSSLANQVNSPMGFDDTIFGYATPSQMHPYPTQTTLLPSIQPTTSQHGQKLNFPVKTSMGMNFNVSSSPNQAGTTLANFNLSTIFPEINKVFFDDLYYYRLKTLYENNQ